MALTIGVSSAASAHANHARSEPAPNAHLATPPTRVLVGFSEKVEIRSSGLALLDQTGREVATQAQPTADPTELQLPLPALPEGVYTVAWHTVSAEDGDAAKGYFAFEVGNIPAVTASPVTQSKTQDGTTVALAVSPGAPGRNAYRVTATRGGAALPNVTRLRLRITPLDRDIGQSEIVLASTAGASYGGSGLELPFAGRYRVEVQVRRSDTVDDVAVDFDLSVSIAVASPSPSAAATTAAASTSAPTAPTTPVAGSAPPAALMIAGLALVLALGAVVLARRRA